LVAFCNFSTIFNTVFYTVFIPFFMHGVLQMDGLGHGVPSKGKEDQACWGEGNSRA
jgi:hypothetical protein